MLNPNFANCELVLCITLSPICVSIYSLFLFGALEIWVKFRNLWSLCSCFVIERLVAKPFYLIHKNEFEWMRVFFINTKKFEHLAIKKKKKLLMQKWQKKWKFYILKKLPNTTNFFYTFAWFLHFHTIYAIFFLLIILSLNILRFLFLVLLLFSVFFLSFLAFHLSFLSFFLLFFMKYFST